MIENEETLMAGLIVMNPPGKVKERNFHREMEKAGHIVIGDYLHPRMQLLTVGNILGGQRVYNSAGMVRRRTRIPWEWRNLLLHPFRPASSGMP